ncbi:hypothetical protein RFI_13467 [Reticulomyxa filosa]|uniref:Uncharacterized protein n=1 Tax=Reticulomyxa filosa TaxID=46433 RepID=X6NBN2_RETFI|nr:hypothetical protein RFI_13467 [Reticulomyxa filosa]|eukprot:ETO23710.1 hypothetical protein RFI_13467 [Reticulomyxa filosa]
MGKKEESGTEAMKSLSEMKTLFEDMATFMEKLAPASKKHIWKHAMHNKFKKKSSSTNGDQDEQTLQQKQVAKLLCDCVIIYIQVTFHLNKKIMEQKNINPKHIKKPKNSTKIWIVQKYKALEKDRFERESTYFSQILQEYSQSSLQFCFFTFVFSSFGFCFF